MKDYRYFVYLLISICLVSCNKNTSSTPSPNPTQTQEPTQKQGNSTTSQQVHRPNPDNQSLIPNLAPPKGNFDFESLIKHASKYEISYKTISCKSTYEFPPKSVKLNWYYDDYGNIKDVEFVGIENDKAIVWGSFYKINMGPIKETKSDTYTTDSGFYRRTFKDDSLLLINATFKVTFIDGYSKVNFVHEYYLSNNQLAFNRLDCTFGIVPSIDNNLKIE